MSSHESVSHQAIVDWLQASRAAAHRSAWADAIRYEGIDLADALLSPLFLGALNAARGGATPKRRKLGLRERAYRVKVALADQLARLRSAAVLDGELAITRESLRIEAIFQQFLLVFSDQRRIN